MTSIETSYLTNPNGSLVLSDLQLETLSNLPSVTTQQLKQINVNLPLSLMQNKPEEEVAEDNDVPDEEDVIEDTPVAGTPTPTLRP